MKQEIRDVYYDAELNVEAYKFHDIEQNLPNRWHDFYFNHYVFGYIVKEKQGLISRIVLIFNPRDDHCCNDTESTILSCGCILIHPQALKSLVYEITGEAYFPYFNQTVIRDDELFNRIIDLHTLIFKRMNSPLKREGFIWIMQYFVRIHTNIALPVIKRSFASQKVEMVCEFLEQKYNENVMLDDLCNLTGLSKFYLLRSFAKHKGHPPHKYLLIKRIREGKRLLHKGVPLAEVAAELGFVDQSHFTRSFKNFIGLTPKKYLNVSLES